MKWVLQTDAHGCGPASLATILGITYSEAKEVLENTPVGFHSGDWAKMGCGHIDLDWALQRRGYWRQREYKAWNRDNWPPKPWAPVHLCQVEQPSNNAHFVVMDHEGVVLDPLQARVDLTLAHYPSVSNVCGLWNPQLPDPRGAA